jgi:TRAP-type C4-dicarboxylate transport system permease small subunit
VVALISKLDKKTAELLDYFCVFCLVVIMVLLLIGVFTRVTGVVLFTWLEEIIYLALSWMVFVKTALIFRKNDHLTISFLSDLLFRKRKVKKLYGILISGITLVTLLVFGCVSAVLCYTATRNSDILAIPFRYWYFSLCFSSFLSSIYIAGSLIREFRS